MLPLSLERKFFAVESKYLRILSIVASYVKSKCRALLPQGECFSLSVKVFPKFVSFFHVP